MKEKRERKKEKERKRKKEKKRKKEVCNLPFTFNTTLGYIDKHNRLIWNWFNKHIFIEIRTVLNLYFH